MNKTYMTPDIQVVKVGQQLLTSGSSKTMNVDSNKMVSDPNAVLGRGGSDWDDED